MNVGSGFAGYPSAGALPDAVAQRFLTHVYQLMGCGLGVTGIVALIISASESLTRFFLGNPFMIGAVVIAQLVTVFAFQGLARRVSEGALAAMFFVYAALTGVTFAAIFLVYTGASIAGTFLVTAGAFGGLAAYGMLTKRDLGPWRSFLFMGLIGVILASVVGFFLHSPALYWLTTFAGVVVFAGLTAYDSARLKQLAATSDLRGEGARKLALMGALTMYLDFINLFILLLRFFGQQRRRD
ncbi:MAG TPA: Bax inhibitor-1/YccA family protein [Polyangia bacterium]|nr:Bax inhibitor-1/YccA family protein [Polyangia bacterium]